MAVITEGLAGHTEATVDAQLAAALPAAELALEMPLIREIRELKAASGALIVAHNYQVPQVAFGVADFVGDSLAMARFAARAQARTIVVCGVRFMGETTKLLSPASRVLLPAPDAGCSLAESITPGDVRRLRARYPGVPVVAYVNTSVAVKAECDVCCTSANAVHIVESLRAPRVIMLPDRYLAGYVRDRVACEIIEWEGACEVHERFTADDIRPIVEQDVRVLAHPECPLDVQQAADFVGSTTAMIDYLAAERPRRVMLLTECSMADNVSVVYPDITFVRPCNLCPHMKRVTLARVRDVLRGEDPGVLIDATVAARALIPVQRMLDA